MSFPYRCQHVACRGTPSGNGPRRSFAKVSPRDAATVGAYRALVAKTDHLCPVCAQPMALDITRLRRKSEKNSTFDTCHGGTCWLPYPHRRGCEGCEHGPELSAERWEELFGDRV